MRLGTTPNQPCERTYSIRLSREVKAVSPANGQPERHRCWPRNIKPKAADTNHEEAAEKPKGLDQAEVAYQEWQALDSRVKSHWRALPARESNQESFGQRVCRYYQSQAESNQSW